MSSKLFVFSRPLPAPFDKAKKKVKVSSKYGDAVQHGGQGCPGVFQMQGRLRTGCGRTLRH